jgi:cell division protein FtsB
VHWLNRILLVGVVLGALALVPDRFELEGSTEDLQRVRAEASTLREGNATLREEIRQLRAEIEAQKADPREVARIAREDLNLVRPGEVVFEVVPQGGQSR